MSAPEKEGAVSLRSTELRGIAAWIENLRGRISERRYTDLHHEDTLEVLSILEELVLTLDAQVRP